MKLTLFSFLLVGVFLFTPQIVKSQSSQIPQDSLEYKVTNYLSEVYLNCPEYADSLHIAHGIEFMSRVYVHHVALNEHPECRLLSSVHLKDKCNPNLINDVDHFNPNTFNPFKYLFTFYAPQAAYFRVDGTEYIIEIKPSHN